MAAGGSAASAGGLLERAVGWGSSSAGVTDRPSSARCPIFSRESPQFQYPCPINSEVTGAESSARGDFVHDPFGGICRVA